MTEEAQTIEAEDQITSQPEELGEAETPLETPAEPAAPSWSAEDEEEARLFGWKSSDEWQGEKPAGYIDNPQEFMDRVQRSRIFQKMQERLDDQDRVRKEETQRLERMNQMALERQKKQYETELQNVRTLRDTAVEEGDMDRYRQLTKQEQDMLADAPQFDATPQQQQPQVDPTLQTYMAGDGGSWLRDPFLGQAAVEIVERSPGAKMLSAVEQAELAKRQLQAIYPDRFPQQEAPKPKQQVQTVDAGGLAGGAGKTNSAFAKLPADAKKQFSRFVSEGLFADTKEDREEYANEYLK